MQAADARLIWKLNCAVLCRGRLTRVEHVDHARQSAAHVAKMLLRGEGAPYDYT